MMVTIADMIELIYIYWSTVLVTIPDIIELIYGILVYRNIYKLTMMVTITDIIELIYGILVYVILTVDNDGYYNRHHSTYLWYTGLP